MFKLWLSIWFKQFTQKWKSWSSFTNLFGFPLMRNTKEDYFHVMNVNGVQCCFETHWFILYDKKIIIMQFILLMKWKVKSSTLHYRIQYSTQCTPLVHPTILQNLKGYAEKFSEKICILWLCLCDLKHTLCVWDIQNLHSPFIQSICNFTCLCIYDNDCLDMVDLEIIPKCPAF